jgi:hypothetical protein
MKIKLHISLLEGKDSFIASFLKTIEIEVNPSNFRDFIRGEMYIGKKPNCHHVKFYAENFNPETCTLRGQAKMLRPACNGYVKDLLEDGWHQVE